MGPAIKTVEMTRSLIRKGMNIARFNFSHGSHEEHGQRIAMVREAAKAEGVPVALILDTKGPEIRTGIIKDNGVINLKTGDTIDAIAEEDAIKLFGLEGSCPTSKYITVSYDLLSEDILNIDSNTANNDNKKSVRILIADGLIGLDVLSVEDKTIHCRIANGGELGSRKNVNVIGVHTRLPAMSGRDKDDLLFGHQQGMDFIAASFIRKPQDVISIQKYLASIGSKMPVISKIEDEEGLDNIEEIIRVSDGIMVARGDMGVQIPPERVPLEQKRIISLCNKEGKPVITATQMLDSMIHNPRPTRAEAGDVANAILDGTDCIMLSGETSAGAYPELAVEVMDRIARTTENSEACRESLNSQRIYPKQGRDLREVIANSACETADSIDAACIIVPTLTGHSAELLSRFRPRRPIVAATSNDSVARRLLLYRGVVPAAVQKVDDSEAMIQGAITAAIREGFARLTDKVVVAAGLPVNSPITCNSIRIHVIGNILGHGHRGFGGRCSGRIFKADTLKEASLLLHKSRAEILLTHTLDESFIPIIRIVDGIILEGMSELSRTQLELINPGLVYVGHVPDAVKHFEDNITVTLDGAERNIYEGSLS
jgi:pyruvate kinase